eukprot:TRINITY_DN9208_c0_g1_i1.p1 TRINITY_DN9208_c0_g1~~TRINITY_DN9208_c0_g1_i1.p1  ORF type:complete len:280 (+),score=47.45 TRINITY_DN9208_c0_g1_i1:31-870(+)
MSSVPNKPTSNNKEDDKKLWYWAPTFPELPSSTISLFQHYCQLSPDEIAKHIEHIRDKAWQIYNYPCIGLYRFLEFSVCMNPKYEEIVNKMKKEEGAKLLDLGCCFGQDIRRLVVDGVDSKNIVGVDLEKPFIDLGFELFKDKESLKAQFQVGDIFQDQFLHQYEGYFDVIHVSSFIHLFEYDQQVYIIKKIAKTLSSKPGSIVLGRQVGTKEPGNYDRAGAPGQLMYRHNEDSFTNMWRQHVTGDWAITVHMKEWEVVSGIEDRTAGRLSLIFHMERR